MNKQIREEMHYFIYALYGYVKRTNSLWGLVPVMRSNYSFWCVTIKEEIAAMVINLNYFHERLCESEDSLSTKTL